MPNHYARAGKNVSAGGNHYARLVIKHRRLTLFLGGGGGKNASGILSAKLPLTNLTKDLPMVSKFEFVCYGNTKK